jgi:uncharacterized protein YyaL (SSP411 family)
MRPAPLLSVLLVAAVLSVASPWSARATEPADPGPAPSPVADPGRVEWRPFGRAAFAEAAESGRPVFLLLTAPWNRDHFLLVPLLFGDPEVAAALAESAVPVRADASLRPELVPLWPTGTGLLPSFHFLDGEGRLLSSFPPLGKEELLFYLDEHRDAKSVPPAEPPSARARLELPADELADRIARLLTGLVRRGESPVAPPHADVDLSALIFLGEYGAYRLQDEAWSVVGGETLRLLRSGLADEVDGGIHRSFATVDGSRVHREKTLRTNADWGGLLAARFSLTNRTEDGRDALLALRFLNARLRTRGTTLYAGSLGADVLDPTGTGLVLEGDRWYALDDDARLRVGVPPASKAIPVGPNWRLHQALAGYFRTYADVRMRRAVARGGPILLAEGTEVDGAARRVLGRPGAGNLRDQGDAGSGLLAWHGLTGDPEPLEAARRLAGAMLERFRRADGGWGAVARDADAPDVVRGMSAPAEHAGVALRFLAELAVVTGDPRWADAADRGLEVEASRVPADGRGAGELGRAALRREAPPPLVVVIADPDTGEGRDLRDLAWRVPDRTALVRWIAPGDRDAARRFGVEPEDEPAVYLVWGEASPALREPVTLRRAYFRAKQRIWR